LHQKNADQEGKALLLGWSEARTEQRRERGRERNPY